MLETQPTPEDRQVQVVPRKVQLALLDDSGPGSLALLLPPVEELLAIRDLANAHVSVNSIARDAHEHFERMFANQYDRMLRRFDKAQESSTYLNRLANLSELAGDLELSQRLIQSAHAREPTSFFALKLSSTFVKQHRLDEATAVLGRKELESDSRAALAIACIEITGRKYDSARARINRVLQHEPLSFPARVLSGVVSVVTSRFDNAVRDFRVALDERPNSALVLSNLAVAYVCLGQPHKALKALRSSININPLNKNAIAFLADLAYSTHADDLSIPALQTFVRYEQKSPAMWSRLARALFQKRKYDEVIAALRNQASLAESAAVWSNLGVAYAEKRDLARAEQYYRYALKQTGEGSERGRLIAGANLCSLLVNAARYKEAIGVSERLIHDDSAGLLRTDEQLCSIYLSNMVALTNADASERVIDRAQSLLIQKEALTPRLVLGLYANLIHVFTLRARNLDLAVQVARDALALPELSPPKSNLDRAQLMLLNNAAFALTEAGLTEEAASVLNRIGRWVHLDPYATATSGFYNLTKGNGLKGLALYREAIGMLPRGPVREHFLQKMNLEMGKYYNRSGEPLNARLHLGRAADSVSGLASIKTEAKQILGSLALKR